MDKRLFFLLNMAQRKLFKTVDQECEKQLNTSVTQLGALMLIDKIPGCQQQAVADLLDLNKSAVTGLLGRMEKNGLVERQRDSKDKRAHCLYSTELGQQKLGAAKPLLKQMNQRLTEEFTEAEIEVILRFLNHILKNT